MHQLSFTRLHSYADRDAGSTAPVALSSGAKVADLVAGLDTGASQCLFGNAYWAEPGLDLTSGVLTRFRTANRSFDAYWHEVEMEVLGIATHSFVYSFAEPLIQKCAGSRRLVGSNSCGLVDHDREIYLADYDRKQG